MWAILKNDVVALVGLAMGGMFLLLGTIAALVLGPNAVRWVQSASWDRVPAHIVSADYEETGSTNGRQLRRPHFHFEYQVGRAKRSAEGFDLVGAYTSNFDWVAEALKRYPAGSDTTALVDPTDPSFAVLERADALDALFLLLGPLFALLGFAGATAGALRARWLQLGKPRHGGWGRLVSATNRAGAFLLQPKLLMGVFFVVIALTSGGLIACGVTNENPMLVITGVVVIFGTWNAARKRR